MNSSLSILTKPQSCVDTCEYSTVGRGFCPDWVPPSPKLACLLEAAGENEIIDKEPLVGATGRLFTYRLITELGYTRSDVLLANTIRCNPPGNAYPVGALRKQAELRCRQYDKALDEYDPNYFVVTLHPAVLLRTWSLLRVIQADMMKSQRFAAKGHRVLVLLGEKATGLVLPGIDGGVTRWRGHNGPLDWSEVSKRWKESLNA